MNKKRFEERSFLYPSGREFHIIVRCMKKPFDLKLKIGSTNYKIKLLEERERISGDKNSHK